MGQYLKRGSNTLASYATSASNTRQVTYYRELVPDLGARDERDIQIYKKYAVVSLLLLIGEPDAS